MDSKDYHDYVIKNGKFIGKFEEMYQNIEDPWLHGKALAIQYDIAIYLINRYNVCNKSVKILDIGCGKGAFTLRIKNNFPKSKITALDISSTAIVKAKKNNRKGIDFKVSDIQKDYKKIKEKYDLIILSEIMWYILPNLKDILLFLSKNVLKKKGYFLVNQAFYKDGIQKYSNKFVENQEDFIKLTKLKLLERIDIHNSSNFDTVMLFKKDDK